MGVKPTTLEGDRVRLEPLELAHYESLCEIGLDERLWRLTIIKVQSAEDMLRYIQTALNAQAEGNALPFVIVEKASNRIIGTSRFHSFNQDQKRVEIGYTWLAVPWQRTSINTEVKYLMLKHAFETWSRVRVEFKANASNEPSRRALLRIGAKHEGILRNYMMSAETGPCDVAMFSIIDSEWPSVKIYLEQKIRRQP